MQGDWELVTTTCLHDNYVNSVMKTGASRRSSQTELGMRLRSPASEGVPARREKITCVDDTIPVVRSHDRFPPLHVCRKHFEKLVGLQDHDWEEGDLDLE